MFLFQKLIATMLHNTNVAAPCLTTPRRGRRGLAPRSKPATRQRRERRRGRSPRLRKVMKRAALRPTRAGAAVEARDRTRQHRERETRSVWMPSGQGPGRHGRHEDTAAVEDDGCRGTTPAARDKAVAASTEAKAAIDDKVVGARRRSPPPQTPPTRRGRRSRPSSSPQSPWIVWKREYRIE